MQGLVAAQKLNGTVNVPGKLHIEGDDPQGPGFSPAGAVASGIANSGRFEVISSRTRYERSGWLGQHQFPAPSALSVRGCSAIERSFLTFSCNQAYSWEVCLRKGAHEGFSRAGRYLALLRKSGLLEESRENDEEWRQELFACRWKARVEASRERRARKRRSGRFGERGSAGLPVGQARPGRSFPPGYPC